MAYQHILFEVSDSGIARLTLNRPDKMNSFNADMHAELRDALDSIQTNLAVRVLVLTGAGRGFCAGQRFGRCRSPLCAWRDPALIWAMWWSATTSHW